MVVILILKKYYYAIIIIIIIIITIIIIIVVVVVVAVSLLQKDFIDAIFLRTVTLRNFTHDSFIQMKKHR